MAKFKSTIEVLKIIKNKDQIRNFSVIAHVDKEEQARGVTIYQANVTLHFTQKDKEYVINMIDTPGHVDFSGRVIRSLRAIDGATVVCDAVEGIMTTQQTWNRMAL